MTPAESSPYYPSSFAGSMGTYARPVMFPGSGHVGGTVVWFGQTSLYFKADGVDYSFTYLSITGGASLTADCLPMASSTYNTHAFITDGINTATVVRHTSATPTCVTKFTFAWEQWDGNTRSYAPSMVSATFVDGMAKGSGLSQPPNYHGTEEDSMAGDMLWTVRGKPCFYSQNQLILGESMMNPFQTSSAYTVTIPGKGSGATQHGMDIFFKVDNNGILHMADWGHDDGGMFGCGNDNMLGSMESTIRLATLGTAPAASG